MHRVYVDSVRTGVLEWLEAIRWKEGPWGRWPYHAAMERPYGLISSAWAIQLLDELGALRDVPEALRNEAVAWLQSTQDSADGHFKDPLVTEGDHAGPHSWEDIWGQMGTAVKALSCLGAAPLHPLPKFFAVDLCGTDGTTYTRCFDWANPWHRGEAWYRGIAFHYDSLPRSQRSPLPPVIREAFAAYEAEVVDPATGLPSRRMAAPANPSVAMAGLFKTMHAYLHVGLPVPHAERAIDATLALQHADGEFGLRNNMCVNWDALWVLRELNRQLRGAYRFAEIRTAGNRAADLLLAKYRRGDGGFSFSGALCTANHHSVRLCAAPQPVGDVMGTLMALHCLRYADEWMRETKP